MNTTVKKQSNRWLWFVISIAAGVVLVCSIAYFVILPSILRPQPLVNDAWRPTANFYHALQLHDYATAYAFLAPDAKVAVGGQTMAIHFPGDLMILEQSRTLEQGEIISYSMADGNFEQGKYTVDMVIQIVRAKKTYTANVVVTAVGNVTDNHWKLVSVDIL
jgi:hypothetical protein